ncbi:uncharacterized protein ARMOST_00422 [Armillaria ostoyae]|uniref:Uncharacterized protein n=1 Tax=Armillaria ostoyae TaxID=47428 RepID=A0A284QL23_ARMOS|nr:uncharacterized protein ARMOST_00422 [Armillaria ostoyae]
MPDCRHSSSKHSKISALHPSKAALRILSHFASTYIIFHDNREARAVKHSILQGHHSAIYASASARHTILLPRQMTTG